jgi:hypothetical protein
VEALTLVMLNFDLISINGELALGAVYLND